MLATARIPQRRLCVAPVVDSTGQGSRSSQSAARARRDAEALARWRGGDQAAGRELFERSIGPLYRFFCNKIDAGVEDMIQDTLLACLESSERYRGDSDFATFLLGIARHKLYKRWRAAAGPRGKVDFTSVSVVDLEPTPSQAVQGAREHAALLTALRSIPVDLQEVVELYYWEELSASQIAEVVGSPEGTIRSRLRRARQLLTTALGDSTGQGADDAGPEQDWELRTRALREVLTPPSAAPVR